MTTAPAPSANTRVNLFGMSRAGLASYFAELGERSFRSIQLLRWMHQHAVTEFAAMTDLGKALRAHLAENAEVRLPATHGEQHSADGTVKWLHGVDSGGSIETVYIPDGQRGTLCVSSQAGCALNCSFCSTARQGFGSNLSSAEIIGQLRLATTALGGNPRSGPRVVTNVVLMGMGEPLLNLDAVVEALDLMCDDNAYGLARRRVTLSTAGVVPGILALAERSPVSLAVSLHAPGDDLRDELVPINRKYPLRELLAACRAYLQASPKEQVTFEYVMLAGVNDAPAQARDLARLLAGLPSKVNLIPFNPFPGAPFRCSREADIDRFREVLMRAGIMTITRKTRGEDIDAACGQLVGRVQARGRRLRVSTAHRARPAASP